MSAGAEAGGGDFQRELQQEVDEIQLQREEGVGDVEVVENEEEQQFQLTEQERRWAMQLKKAALQKTEENTEAGDEDDDDEDDDNNLLPVVSDFEYVQVAMIYQDDVEGGLRAIKMMLEFRQQYCVESGGNAEQGVHCMAAWMEQQPGFLLHMDVNPEGEAVKVFDPGVLNPKAALAGRNWSDFIRGVYYLHIACQPSLLAVRKGLTLLLDFGDVDSSNVSLDVQYQFFAELCSWYPVQINSYMAFHTGFGATMRLSLMKAVMPKRISSKIQLGCDISNNGEGTYGEDGTTINRLRQFYLVPTLQEAQLHTLHRAKVLLEERAHNERTFRL